MVDEPISGDQLSLSMLFTVQPLPLVDSAIGIKVRSHTRPHTSYPASFVVFERIMRVELYSDSML